MARLCRSAALIAGVLITLTTGSGGVLADDKPSVVPSLPIADYFGCQSLETLTRAYALLPDQIAFANFLAPQVLSGECITFFPGDKVYPIEWETLTNSVRVHLDGDPDMYWARVPLTGPNAFMKPPFPKNQIMVVTEPNSVVGGER
jgi:hypothetical protein